MALTKEQENTLILESLAMGMGASNPETLNRLTLQNKQQLAIILKRMVKEGLVTSNTFSASDLRDDDDDEEDKALTGTTRIVPTNKGMQLLDRSG